MELYNLYIGDKNPNNSFSSVKIGPYQVSLKDNYDSLIKILPSPNRISRQCGGEWDYIHGNTNGWIATADCVHDGSKGKSILALKPIEDNGLWDLCQILTFLNGRNIIDNPNDTRLNPNKFGDRACIDVEVLSTAREMWEKRQTFVDRKLVYSLLLYNLAFNCLDVNSRSGVINPSFNGVYDDWHRNAKNDNAFQNISDLSTEEKKDIRQSVINAIDLLTIDKNKSEAIKNILSSKIEGGLVSPVNLIQAMLSYSGIIPVNPTKESLDRIKFMNTVRNKFVHTGGPPEYKKNPNLSVEISIFVIGRLIPDIIQMYLGKVAGFTNRSFGSLCQHTHTLTEYFVNGKYNEFEVENDSYDEMMNEIISKSSNGN